MIGLDEYTQDAILNPQYKSLRETRSLYYWVRNTLLTNFTSLLRLKEKLKQAAKKENGVDEETCKGRRSFRAEDGNALIINENSNY